jgi:hypothetical protein
MSSEKISDSGSQRSASVGVRVQSARCEALVTAVRPCHAGPVSAPEFERWRVLAVLAGVVTSALLVAGCGGAVDGPATGPAAAPLAAPSAPAADLAAAGYEGRFRATGTILESPEHGPQLCHAVAESFPPQCSGLDVAGWDWSAVEAESAEGTTWGSYVLVGTFDGEAFTLTEPPIAADQGDRAPSADGPDFSTPCPEPDGGWAPVDLDRATEAALQAAVARAPSVDGFGDLWIDQRLRPEDLTEATANDPRRIVLNVSTTGDLAATEEELREVRGGALCVSRAAASEAELLEVQAATTDLPGFVSSSPDPRTGQLVVQALVASQELQAELDDRFGPGVVRLEGLLRPLD